jgi:pimeloyl-ACP methyl ester carboxylesterase
LNTIPTSDPAASENWASIGELRVRYLDWGGDGVPVMMLHGLASSAHWYDLVAPQLRDQHRIIAPDQRGHGQTTQANIGYDWGLWREILWV